MPQEETPKNPDSLRALADAYGLPLVEQLDEVEVAADLIASLPVAWAREHLLVPVRVGGVASLLTPDPLNVERQQHVNLVTGHQLPPVLASPELIASCIERCYSTGHDSPSNFIDEQLSAAIPEVLSSASEDLLGAEGDTPVTRLVNLIVLDALKQRASDIHFEPLESHLRVRFRIDGTLYEQASPPRNMTAPLVSRLKVMGHMDIAEKRLPQDGMARLRVGPREIDVRLSTVPVADGERVVLRLLDREQALLPLDQLGLASSTLDGFRGMLTESNGMVVVCGATGSGKTTTLYAALNEIDTSRKNVLTIEEPVEYQLENIGQIQVHPKIGLTFSMGLRHILRQDPDVVLVGETRDLETAEIAIRASLTGHLVFTTLHTNDAVGALVRLTDMGVEPYLVASCLRGVLAQRLLRKLCPLCRRGDVVDAARATALGDWAVPLTGQTVYSAVGCSACMEGYAGRIGIFELITVDDEIRQLIRSEALDVAAVRRSLQARGVAGLVDSALDKVRVGETSLEEVATLASLVSGG